MPLVPVTIDGKIVNVEHGLTSFAELVRQAGLNPKTYKITIVSIPSAPTAINGNDSYRVQGGEVLTTVHN
jgi:hypothetical protein